MKPRHIVNAFASIVPVLGLLPGCAIFSNQVAGVRQVDDLVGRIERVHLEAELSKARVRDALETLHIIVDDDFIGDPLVAFEGFLEAIEVSTEQAEVLEEALTPVKETGFAVFNQWEADLLTFSMPEMRNRSRMRLEETRESYNKVVQATESAHAAFQTFNLGLHDHATFLGNDFNPAAVREIQREVQTLSEWAREVENRLDATLDACELYVESAALPGSVSVAPGGGQGSAGPGR